MKRRFWFAAVAGLVAVALSGCTALEESAESPSSPPADSVSADSGSAEATGPEGEPEYPDLTDDEAHDIALALYEEFHEALVQLVSSGGESMADLEAITTSNMEGQNAESLELAQSEDFYVEGRVQVVKSEFISYENGVIDILMCIDPTTARTYYADGTPVVEEVPDVLHAFTFTAIHTPSGFKVDWTEFWTETPFCWE